MFDLRAGTAVTEYRGPELLKEFCERFGIELFNRVTKLRIGKADLDKLDLNVFSELELIKGTWAYSLKGSEQEKWASIADDPLTQKVKETYSKCQLKLDANPEIKILKNTLCSKPAGQ